MRGRKMKLDEDLVFQRWEKIHNMPKTLFGYPSWKSVQEQTVTRQKAKILNSKIPLKSRLTVRVCDANDGLNMQNVEVRIIAPNDGTLNNTSCIFCIDSECGWTAISRMDFYPDSPHMNKDWKKLNIPGLIEGNHYHSFHLNRKIGLIRFKPKGGNVDNAEKILSPVNSFHDIFDLIEKEWNINGASALPVPEQQGGFIF